MRIHLKRFVLVGALGLSFGIAGGITPRAVSAQEHHEMDYSKNKNYQLGMRDGRDDWSHKRDHYKKRHFKKDEDQKAYEMGYQEGHRDSNHR